MIKVTRHEPPASGGLNNRSAVKTPSPQGTTPKPLAIGGAMPNLRGQTLASRRMVIVGCMGKRLPKAILIVEAARGRLAWPMNGFRHLQGRV